MEEEDGRIFLASAANLNSPAAAAPTTGGGGGAAGGGEKVVVVGGGAAGYSAVQTLRYNPLFFP